MCAKNQFDFKNPDSSKSSVADSGNEGIWLVVPEQYRQWQESQYLEDMELTGRELVAILDELILERDNNDQ